MHDMLKRKKNYIYIYIYIYAKNMKSKKNQNAFKMVASVFLGDVRII